MAEFRKLEDGDLELPEEEEDEEGLIRYHLLLEALSTKKLVCFCLRTMVSK